MCKFNPTLILLFFLLLVLASCEGDIDLPAVPSDDGVEHIIKPFCLDIPNTNEDATHSHDRNCGQYNLTLGGKLSTDDFKPEVRPYPNDVYIVIPVGEWYDAMVYLVSKGVVKRAITAVQFIVWGTIPDQWKQSDPMDTRGSVCRNDWDWGMRLVEIER